MLASIPLLVLPIVLVACTGGGGGGGGSAGSGGTGGAGAGGASGMGGGAAAGSTGGSAGCDADLTSDPHNCGECGRACEESCDDGVCAPRVIASGIDFHGGSMLSRGRLRLDEGHVYFGLEGVVRCPKSGCTAAPETVLPNAANWDWVEDFVLLPAGAGTFAITRSRLLHCATGCTSETVVADLADDGVVLMIVDQELRVIEQGRIETCPVDACTSLSLDGFTGDVGDAVFDDELWMVGFAGVTTGTQFSSLGGDRLALDADGVYWTTSSSAMPIVRCDRHATTCPTPTPLWDGEGASAVAVDGAHVYWTARGIGGETGALYRCSTPACTTPVVLAKGLDRPVSVVLDDQYAYVLDFGQSGATPPTGSVLRFPK